MAARQTVEAEILARLSRGALYMRSFQRVKPIVEGMIERGVLRRVAPLGMRARNMVEIVRDDSRRAPLSREDSFAELIANGASVAEAGRRLLLTPGQTARTWADIKAGLGAQAR